MGIIYSLLHRPDEPHARRTKQLSTVANPGLSRAIIHIGLLTNFSFKLQYVNRPLTSPEIPEIVIAVYHQHECAEVDLKQD